MTLGKQARTISDGDVQKLIDAAEFVARSARKIESEALFLMVPREAIGLLRITLNLIEGRGDDA